MSNAPHTLPSAARDDDQHLRERIRAEVLEQVRREMRQSIPVRTVERPPRSRMERLRESKWTLAGLAGILTAVAAVVAALRGGSSTTSAPPPRTPVETLLRIQRIEDTLDMQWHNRANHRRFIEGSLCQLGVRPSWGCPGIGVHPPPLEGEDLILPKAYVPPEPQRLPP